MALSAAGLYTRARTMIPEVLKFGIVGGIGSVVDLGGTAVLHSQYHVGPLVSKAVAVTLATMVTYLGSRFWTFKERENQSARREAALFIVLNVVGLLIAEAVIGLVTYVLGLHGKIEFNAASVLGTGLGTIFRFYAYRKWVFLAPPQAARQGRLVQRPRVPRLPAVGVRPRPSRRPCGPPAWSPPRWLPRRPHGTSPPPPRRGTSPPGRPRGTQRAACPPPGARPPRTRPAPGSRSSTRSGGQTMRPSRTGAWPHRTAPHLQGRGRTGGGRALPARWPRARWRRPRHRARPRDVTASPEARRTGR